MKKGKPKILTAKCRWCGGEVYSLYEKQLKQFKEKHEEWCPERKKEEDGQA
jgi:hypothetical protein